MLVLFVLGAGAAAYFSLQGKAAVTYQKPENTTATSGLVALWSFNGKDLTTTTAYDRSGSGKNGTLTNAPAPAIGKVGQGLRFNGSNSYVSAGNVSSGVKTVSFWIKPSTATQKILDLNGTQTIEVSSQTLQANSFTSPTIYVDGSVSSLIDTDWHHVAITTATAVSASAVNIGKVSTGYLNGTLDEVRFYDRALSQSEIQALYRSGGEVEAAVAWICGTSTVSDQDGNTYNTLLIGTQCWMKQNLRTGTRIAGTTAQTNNGTIEKYCYSDTDSNCTSNNPNQPDGGLYQWDEAMQYSTTPGARGICPSGWHIPTHDEWTTLERGVCTSGSCTTDFPYDTSTTDWRGTDEGTKLKPNGSSLFEGNLAGNRNTDGSFNDRGTNANLWSSSESGSNAWRRNLNSGNATVNRNTNDKANGFSVRCLKD